MSNAAMDAARMMELLPVEEQNFALEFIKRLVRAWDPDFTKLTAPEAAALAQAENDEFVSDADIDWDNLEKYQ